MRITIKDKNNFILMFNEMFYDNTISQINGITIDSRKIEKNDLFIPIKGENYDGHDFIDDAIKKGALLCFSEKKSNIKNRKVIKVRLIQNLINQFASMWQKKSKAQVIGITGSNGKTTTKELLYSFLSKKYQCSKTKGNFNSLIGLPLTYLNSKTNDDFNILEYGASRPNEIDKLCKIVKPDYGLITNISESHIENYSSFNQLKKTKSALYMNLIDNNIAFINNEINYLADLKLNCKKITFGFDKTSDYKAHEIQKGNNKYIKVNNNLVSIPRSLYHLKENILSAYSIANHFKINHKDINDCLKYYIVPQGRGNKIKLGKLNIIDDSYNANPESVKLAINRFNTIKTSGKKIFILGDMLELGNNSNKNHIEIAKIIEKSKINIVITFGDISKNTTDSIKNKNIKTIHYYSDQLLDLKNQINKIATENDLIYLKGSRSMKLERVYK